MIEYAKTALAEFRKQPSGERLCAVERAISGNVPYAQYREAIAELGLTVDDVWPFLSTPATGRGYERRDPGHAAARLLSSLDFDVERAKALVAGKDKVARENAAFLLAYCDLRAGSRTAFLEYASNKQLASGAWRALRWTTSNWRAGYEAQNIPMKPLVPAMEKALAAKSPMLVLALDALNDWQFDWERRKDFALIFKPLVALLDHPKPTVAKDASRYVSNYLWAIVHDHAPFNPDVNLLAKRKDKYGAEALARIRAKKTKAK